MGIKRIIIIAVFLAILGCSDSASEIYGSEMIQATVLRTEYCGNHQYSACSAIGQISAEYLPLNNTAFFFDDSTGARVKFNLKNNSLRDIASIGVDILFVYDDGTIIPVNNIFSRFEEAVTNGSEVAAEVRVAQVLRDLRMDGMVQTVVILTEAYGTSGEVLYDRQHFIWKPLRTVPRSRTN